MSTVAQLTEFKERIHQKLESITLLERQVSECGPFNVKDKAILLAKRQREALAILAANQIALAQRLDQIEQKALKHG